jgi:hypothetical protein
MKRAIEIIKRIASETDRAILFNSASGKDSIALLDMMSPHFREVVCVYMYIVKDLEHINRYFRYYRNKYPNTTLVQVPHFVLPSYYNVGYLGCEKKQVRQQTMISLTDKVRERYGVEWAFFGFKQSDSLNRRIMLRAYDQEAINRDTRKCYPLSTYKNKDVLAYIEKRNLMRPEKYGKGQSAGVNLTDPYYLSWLRANFPQDLQRIYAAFPEAERYLFEFDYGEKNSTR